MEVETDKVVVVPWVVPNYRKTIYNQWCRTNAVYFTRMFSYTVRSNYILTLWSTLEHAFTPGGYQSARGVYLRVPKPSINSVRVQSTNKESIDWSSHEWTIWIIKYKKEKNNNCNKPNKETYRWCTSCLGKKNKKKTKSFLSLCTMQTDRREDAKSAGKTMQFEKLSLVRGIKCNRVGRLRVRWHTEGIDSSVVLG